MEKYNKLLEYIKNLHSVAVAFSGGVDSAFLLKAAKEAVGDRVLAVTVSSCLMPKREIKEAKEFCKTQGIEQIICDIDPFLADGFSANPKNRCYICKKNILTNIKRVAGEHGIYEIMEGSNLDDTGDYRPGMQAVCELTVRSPLKELGFTVTRPGGTFYIMPKALEEDAVAFCRKALKYDLILVPADSFCAPGYFRMAYCVETEKVRRSLEAIRRFVREEYGK